MILAMMELAALWRIGDALNQIARANGNTWPEIEAGDVGTEFSVSVPAFDPPTVEPVAFHVEPAGWRLPPPRSPLWRRVGMWIAT